MSDQPQAPAAPTMPPVAPAPQANATYAPTVPVTPAVNADQPRVLTELSGGMKFGWLVVGFFMGLMGILIAWLVNADKAVKVKNGAIKFSAIGLAVGIALGIILFIVFGTMTALLAGVSGAGLYY